MNFPLIREEALVPFILASSRGKAKKRINIVNGMLLNFASFPLYNQEKFHNDNLGQILNPRDD